MHSIFLTSLFFLDVEYIRNIQLYDVGACGDHGDLESDLKRKLKIEAGKHGGQKRVGVRVQTNKNISNL